MYSHSSWPWEWKQSLQMFLSSVFLQPCQHLPDWCKQGYVTPAGDTSFAKKTNDVEWLKKMVFPLQRRRWQRRERNGVSWDGPWQDKAGSISCSTLKVNISISKWDNPGKQLQEANFWAFLQATVALTLLKSKPLPVIPHSSNVTWKIPATPLATAHKASRKKIFEWNHRVMPTRTSFNTWLDQSS